MAGKGYKISLRNKKFPIWARKKSWKVLRTSFPTHKQLCGKKGNQDDAFSSVGPIRTLCKSFVSLRKNYFRDLCCFGVWLICGRDMWGGKVGLLPFGSSRGDVIYCVKCVSFLSWEICSIFIVTFLSLLIDQNNWWSIFFRFWIVVGG